MVENVLNHGLEEEESLSLLDFLEGYPDSVKEEFMQGARTLPKNRQAGALQMLYSPVAPSVDYFYDRVARLLGPNLNKIWRAQHESHNRALESLGVEPRGEYQDVTREQLAVPLAIAGSLMRGTWYSPLIRAVVDAKQSKATGKQWLAEIKKGGGTKELKETDLVHGPLRSHPPYALSDPFSTGLEGLLEGMPPDKTIQARELLEILVDRRFPLITDVLEGEDAEYAQGNLNLPIDDSYDHKEILLRVPDSPQYRHFFPTGPWQDPHYPGYHNVLANIRFNSGSIDGEKVFMLQEVESTVHQKAEALRREEVDRIMRLKGWRSPQRSEVEAMVPKDFSYVPDSDGRIRVPNLPFKKTWHELAFKRALMEALKDPTLKKFVWTDGRTQAERAYGKDWEDTSSDRAKLFFDIYDKKLVQVAKKLLFQTPKRISTQPGYEDIWIIGNSKEGGYLSSFHTGATNEDGRAIDVILAFDSKKEALEHLNHPSSAHLGPEWEVDTLGVGENAWSIDLEEARDSLKENASGETKYPLPIAQKEGDGILEVYA